MAEEKKLSRIIEIKDQYTNELNKYRQQLKSAKKDTDDLKKSVDDANKSVSKSANTSNKKSNYVMYDPKQIEAEMNAYTKARDQIKSTRLSSNDKTKIASEIDKIRNTKTQDALPSVNFTKKDEANHKKVSDALDDIGKKGKKANDNMPGSMKMKHNSGLSGLIYKLGMLQMGFFSVQMAIAAVGKMTGAVVSDISDNQKSLTSLQNKTGMSADEVNQYRGSIADIYKSGYGTNKEEISGIMGTITQQLGNLSPSDMTDTVKSIYAIKDSFGTDENELIKAASSMGKEFGTSTKDSMNLIVQGMQNGLNSNGDFLKQIGDSAKSWKDLGFTDSEAINMMKAGIKSGSFDTADINNAIKQLDDRTRSGDNKKALTMLGLNQKQTKENMNAGGDTAKQSTMDIFRRLSIVTDPSKQYKIGKELFGDQWKEINSDAIKQLIAFDDSINAAKNSLNDLMNNSNSSLGDEFRKTFRDLHEAVLPIEDSLIPILKDFNNWIENDLNPIVKKVSSWLPSESPSATTAKKVAKTTTKAGLIMSMPFANNMREGINLGKDTYSAYNWIKDKLTKSDNTELTVDGNKNGRKAGIRRVPYDNYYTFLHEGETVLTKRESEDLVHNGSSGGTSIAIAKLADSITVREESDIDKITTMLVKKLQSNKLSFGGA